MILLVIFALLFLNVVETTKYFESMTVGCFPPSLEDKNKHFLMLADDDVAWTPNKDVTDGTFSVRFDPHNRIANQDGDRYMKAAKNLKVALPSLQRMSFQSMVIQGPINGGILEFSQHAHREYHAMADEARKFLEIMKKTGYELDRFFFTLMIPRRLCEEDLKQPNLKRNTCPALSEKMVSEFSDERDFIIKDEKTVITINRTIVDTHFQFMVSF